MTVLAVGMLAFSALLTPVDVTAEEKLDAGSEAFFSGNALYNRRLYSLAIAEYKAFLQKYPNHARVADARRGIALSYFAEGNWKQAEVELANVLKTPGQKGVDQLRLMRAQSLAKLNRGPESLAEYEKVAASKDQNLRQVALAGVVDAASRAQDWEMAAKRADQLLKENPEANLKMRALYQGANARFQLKAYEEAIPMLKELQPLVKGTPYEPQAAFVLAECYRETGDLPAASRLYSSSLPGLQGESAAEVAYRLGLTHFRSGEFEDAIHALNQSIKLSKDGPFAVDSKILAGRACLELKDYNGATRYLKPLSETRAPKRKKNKKGKEIDPHAEASLWYARVFSRRDNYKEAERVLQAASQMFARDPMIHDLLYDLANAQMMNQKFPQAAGTLGRIPADYGQRADVLRLMAECYHRVKDYNRSLQMIDLFLKDHAGDDDSANVEFMKAENLFFLKRPDDALKIYELIRTRDKTSPNAESSTFRLAQIYREKGESEKVSELLAGMPAKPSDKKPFGQVGFVAGDAAFRQQKWADAIELHTAFVNRFSDPRKHHGRTDEPNVDAALVQVAVSSLNLGKPDDAISTFERVLRMYQAGPQLPLTRAELGRLYYEKGDRRRARQHLDQFVQHHAREPQRPQVDYYLGWIASDEKRLPDAEKLFAQAVANRKHALAADAMMQLGRVRAEQQNYNAAVKAFDDLIRSWPAYEQLDLAIFSKGLAYARMKRWPQAAADFQTVIDKYAESTVADRALYEIAWAKKGLKKNEEAIAHYQALLQKHPQSSLVDKVHTELAELTFAKADFDQVIAELKQTYEKLKDPKLKADTTYRLGTAYFNKQDYENAASTFESYVTEYAKGDKRSSAFFQAGESRMRLKEHIKAREHFGNAIRNNPPDAMKESSHMRLGETQRLTRQYREATGTYRNFIRMFPQSKWMNQARFDLGWCMEMQKQYPQAIGEYRQVLAAGKKDELAARSQFQIGECLFAQNKYDEAIQELVKVTVAHKHKKWQARAALEMARALEAKGDKDAALAQYREVMQKYPDDADVVTTARKNAAALRR